ncbi:autotransporter assembly complex family protein [Rhodoferax sp. WC2427]|uniref:autotransporter assembly complex protein TamA n=1 Tax=Rhodoferax sp. WC2427 TaxID=3234144 RepID=UPI0034670327
MRRFGKQVWAWCWLLLLPGLLWAQTPAPKVAPFAFDLHVVAPDKIRDLLLKHLELQRYRSLTDLDDTELARLMQAAERNTHDLLATQGYFAAQVAVELTPTPLSTSAPRDITITVAPGEPVRVQTVQVEFTGPIADTPADASLRETIRSDWPLGPNTPFTQDAWDDAKTQALRNLTVQRFPTGEISNSLADIDPDTQTAQLSLTLASGPAYRFGPLEMRGLQRYSAELVSRLAQLPTGADYSQAQMLQTQQRLADSGYFDSVFLTLDTSGDPQAAPVVAQLREAKLQKLVLGVGFSTDSGPRLSAEHTHHQLPWLQWRAISKLSLDKDTQTLGTELTAPPDASNWRWVTSAQVQHQNLSDTITNSQRLRAGRTQGNDHIDRNVYLQYDHALTTSGTDPTVASSAISANYAWTRRDFDDIRTPTQGYGVAVELGGGFTLGGDRQPYTRALTRWLGYFPLGKLLPGDGLFMRAGRLALRAEAGAVVAKADANVPSTQQFLTGGDTTVRGYGYQEIGVAGSSGSVTAGRYLASGSFEWQRPIVINGKASAWETALFVDAGAVANTVKALEAKVGVGAGVRWRSPVGPVQLDIAYGVATRKARLHMSVGFSF